MKNIYTLLVMFCCLNANSQKNKARLNDSTTNTATHYSLEDVVVTAQKKEELAQKIPMSLTVFSSNTIDQLKLWSNKNISGLVPNLYSADPGDHRDIISIRGISSTSYDPAVVTYIDGVAQFNLDTYIPTLNDIERIEVLRGPQGTLYGRNAMGGVIHIITKQPNNSTHGSAEITTGNYGLQRIIGSIKFPIIHDKLFFGVSILKQQRNGYYINSVTQNNYDEQSEWAGNYYIKYLPLPKWEVVWNFKNYQSDNQGAFPLTATGIQDAFLKPFELSQNALTTMKDKTWNSSLLIQHKGERIDFTSTTAFQQNYRYYTQPIDGDFSPLDAISIVNNFGNNWNKIKVVTQEFKWNSSPNLKNKLNWTAGAFLFYQDAPTKQATRFGKDANMLMIGDSLFSIINETSVQKKGIAVFGQLNYTFHPQWQLTLGIRNDYEKQNQTVAGYYQHDPSPSNINIFPVTQGDIQFNSLSPKIALQYQVSSQSIMYVQYSQGYRVGGLSPLSSDPSQPPLISYLPEHSQNYEWGIKNSWMQDRLRLQLSLFMTKVNDAQVPTLILPDAITVIQNIGKLKSQGVELELYAQPNKGLKLSYHGGITDASYLKTGMHPVFTPKYSQSITIHYDFLSTMNSSFYVQTQMRWIGDTYFDVKNELKQSAYFVEDFNIGWNLKANNISIWSKNIWNKKYIAYAYDFGAIHLGDPSLFGISLSRKF
jgi:iron complex outermembrane receptor protein